MTRREFPIGSKVRFLDQPRTYTVSACHVEPDGRARVDAEHEGEPIVSGLPTVRCHRFYADDARYTDHEQASAGHGAEGWTMSEETYYPKTSACLAIFTRVQLEAVAFAMTKALEGEMGDHRTPDEGAMQTLGRYLPEHLKTPMPTNFGDCLPKDATRIDAVPGGVGYEPTMKEALASLVERYKREIADDHLAKGYHAPVGLPEVRAKLAFAEDLLAELSARGEADSRGADG